MIKKMVVALIAISGIAHAEPTNNANKESRSVKDKGFYIKAGSGASFAQRAHISAPSIIWDPAEQGYNGALGTAPILLGGIGYDSPWVSTDITVSYRPNFDYNKLQTPTTSSTPGTLGQTTRRFNLDVASWMLTVYLNGRGISVLNWRTGDASSVYPVIGGGVGGSQMTIFNFRSTGLPSVSAGLASFASENQYTVRYRFTYQVMGGFEFRYRDVCALSIGYRWFDVAQFKGPRYLRDSEGNALDVQNNTWKIKFAANEAFVEFKVLL